MCANVSPLIRRSVAVFAGSPCTCAPGRYVRFAIPKVPGIHTAIVSCRAIDETGPQSVHEHPLPVNTYIAVRIPSIDGRGLEDN